MTVPLFCPRCADPMVEDGGELTCRRGDMRSAPRMRERLEDYVR